MGGFGAGNERGATVVLVALSLLALVGFAALAVDGGVAYNERRATQNAADQAALAAAWAACTSAGDPISAGVQTAAANGFAASSTVTVEILPEGGNTYRARITSTGDTRFARAQGTDTVTVVSEAVADCTALGGLGGYAIFGGADTCGNVVDISGASVTVNGGVHSNDDIKSTGGTHTYNGPVDAVGTILSPQGTFNGGRNEGVASRDYPVPAYWLDVDYWRSVGTRVGPGNLSTANFPTPGVYFVEGNARLMGVSLNGVTLVATGEINATGPDNSLSPAAGTDGLTLLSFAHAGYYQQGVSEDRCTRPPAIHLSASRNGWNGVILAPNGGVQISNAAGFTTFNLSGSIIAWTVKNSASGFTVTYDPSLGGEPQYSVDLLR